MADDRLNRYSMPVTRSRSYMAELNIDHSLDGNNTTGFLFGDEESGAGEAKNYQQMNNADNFPTLVRNAGYPNMVSRTFPLGPAGSIGSGRQMNAESATVFSPFAAGSMTSYP